MTSLFFLLFISTENKQTNDMEVSRVLPFDKLKAELFYPERTDNISTKALATNMAVEMDSCILNELRGPKKAASDYLSSGKCKFSWGYTTQEEHQACIGMMAYNDPSESPFAPLTRQLQSFGHVLGINDAAGGCARHNDDFLRSSVDYEGVGAFHKLGDEMRESLLRFSISLIPTLKRGERDAIERQREAKGMKKEVLGKKKLLAAQKEYYNDLTYIEMYLSQACWRSEEDVAR